MAVNIKKNRPGLTRVWPGGSGPGSTRRVDRVSPGHPAGSTGFYRANSQAGFYLHPDRSQARVAGQPAGPVRVSKHCLILQNKLNSRFWWKEIRA
jgi:hypothetical protein